MFYFYLNFTFNPHIWTITMLLCSYYYYYNIVPHASIAGGTARVQVASNGFTSPSMRGDRAVTETRQGNSGQGKERPERRVKPRREAWGDGEHHDVISIDLQGEQIFTALHNCYHWTDRNKVGGLVTSKCNSIRPNNAQADLRGQKRIKLKSRLWIRLCIVTGLLVFQFNQWIFRDIPALLNIYIFLFFLETCSPDSVCAATISENLSNQH